MHATDIPKEVRKTVLVKRRDGVSVVASIPQETVFNTSVKPLHQFFANCRRMEGNEKQTSTQTVETFKKDSFKDSTHEFQAEIHTFLIETDLHGFNWRLRSKQANVCCKICNVFRFAASQTVRSATREEKSGNCSPKSFKNIF